MTQPLPPAADYAICPADWAREVPGEDGPATVLDIFITATLPDGRRWNLNRFVTTDPQRALDLCEKIERKRDRGKWAGACNNKSWTPALPVYGSLEYQRCGGDRGLHSDLEPELLGATEDHKERLARENEDRQR